MLATNQSEESVATKINKTGLRIYIRSSSKKCYMIQDYYNLDPLSHNTNRVVLILSHRLKNSVTC